MKTNQTKLLLVALLTLLHVVGLRAENYPYRSDVLWTTIPSHGDWLYKVGENAKVEVTFLKYGIPRDVEVNYEIGPERMKATRTGGVRLKNGRATINLGTMKSPGFLDCKLKAVADGSTYEHHVKVGFSPDKLMPYTKNPDDFDDFWTSVLAEARKQPLTFTQEKVEKYSTSDFDCYLIHLQVDRQGHSIYAYLTRPKAAGKYPVVLCPPGAGIKTIKEPMKRTFYAKNGFIRLEMEIHGLHPELSGEQFAQISRAFNGRNNGYIENGMDNRDNAYLKHVYAACVRAMDYLTSLDDWDGKNVVVQGGSQGGALALVTAALDNRVTLCVANHPALADMAGSLAGRTDGYPHLVNMNQQLTPDRVRALQYYDVVNFARRVKCPVYMTWGFNDNTCPPTTSYIVWNLLSCPKESLITPINEHWTSDRTNYHQMEYIKAHLR